MQYDARALGNDRIREVFWFHTCSKTFLSPTSGFDPVDRLDIARHERSQSVVRIYSLTQHTCDGLAASLVLFECHVGPLPGPCSQNVLYFGVDVD